MKSTAMHLAMALVSAALLAVAASAHALQPTGTATGYVQAVSDGDTFYIEIEGQRTSVRLAQIDAPEKGQAFGNRSGQSLRDLVWKKNVTVVWSSIDRYGRPVVEVDSDGINVSAEQVRRGMAWVYRKYARNMALYDLEQDAVGNERGLWTDPQPIPPWEWRKTNRGRHEGKASTD